jgi:hypothetical protein
MSQIGWLLLAVGEGGHSGQVASGLHEGPRSTTSHGWWCGRCASTAFPAPWLALLGWLDRFSERNRHCRRVIISRLGRANNWSADTIGRAKAKARDTLKEEQEVGQHRPCCTASTEYALRYLVHNRAQAPGHVVQSVRRVKTLLREYIVLLCLAAVPGIATATPAHGSVGVKQQRPVLQPRRGPEKRGGWEPGGRAIAPDQCCCYSPAL